MAHDGALLLPRDGGNPQLRSLNARRRAALEDIDNASFSFYHVRTCLVTGVGFFADAYDIFAISIAATMIGYVYGHPSPTNPGGPNELSWKQDLGLKVATPVGTLFGQLVFGWLADIVGRKKMYGVELVIIIFGTFVQTFACDSKAVGIVGTLVVYRFLTGIGIGGDYPLSSVIVSEFAATRIRGRMMTAVFSVQGLGTLTGALVSLIVVDVWKTPIRNHGSVDEVDYLWRILIGIGCIPAVIGLYFRLTIPESPRYTMDIERNVLQAAQDIETFYSSGTYNRDENMLTQRVEAPVATRRDFFRHFSRWENGKVLLGTSWSWFALDFAFYGLSLNSSLIITAIGFGDLGGSAQDIWTNLYKVSIGNIILAAAGLIPGFIVAFLLIDKVGRKPLQFGGFGVATIIFVIMAIVYPSSTSSSSIVNERPRARGLLALYCILNFFLNLGPNTTTFIIPGEVFPTRYRSTGHGISAASGKLGGIVAQVVFSIVNSKGSGSTNVGGELNSKLRPLFGIFAALMATGVVSTLAVPETRGRTLEDLSNEEQMEFVMGVTPQHVTEDGLVIPRDRV